MDPRFHEDDKSLKKPKCGRFSNLLFRHSREGGNPEKLSASDLSWIPIPSSEGTSFHGDDERYKYLYEMESATVTEFDTNSDTG